MSLKNSPCLTESIFKSTNSIINIVIFFRDKSTPVIRTFLNFIFSRIFKISACLIWVKMSMQP